jgi:hypothetical protein
MVEISKRKIEMESTFLMYNCFQVSINSHGHIVLRWFDKSEMNQEGQYEVGKEFKGKRETTDFIIVLTKDETEQLIRFIRSINRIDC